MTSFGHTSVSVRCMPWQESLKRHIGSLEYMALQLDVREVTNVLQVMRSCRGLIIFTGVGQNSLLASKVASTYGSVGIRAASMDSVALLHGGLGFLQSQDLLVLLSKSGETAELLRLMAACRDIGHSDTLAVHSARGSTLEALAACSVYIPILSEADHLDMVPTASAACFLSFLHALAVQLSSESGLTAAMFLRTHPAGTLGRNLPVGES